MHFFYLFNSHYIRIMKLKLLLLVCSVIFTDHVYSQNGGKWSFGVYFSPDFCYRTLRNHDGSEGVSIAISKRNDFEIPKLGYSTGFIVKRRLNDLFSIESGIGFNDKGYHTKSLPVAFPNNPDAPNVSASHAYHYLFLNVPLKGNYQIPINDKWKFSVGLGIEYNAYLDNYIKSDYYYIEGYTTRSRYNDRSIYNYTDFHLMATGNIGFEYSVNKTVSLRAEPTFRRALNSFVDEAVHAYLWNVGISFGCLVKM